MFRPRGGSAFRGRAGAGAVRWRRRPAGWDSTSSTPPNSRPAPPTSPGSARWPSGTTRSSPPCRRRRAVLPVRLGTIFQSRDSLLARLNPLPAPGGRVPPRTRRPPGMGREIVRRRKARERKHGADAKGDSPMFRRAMLGTGPRQCTAHCWTARDSFLPAARQLPGRQRAAAPAPPPGERAARQTAAATVEDRLGGLADSWQRLRALPHVLTNRREDALECRLPPSQIQLGLLPGRQREQLRRELAPGGLMVEVTGPWPAYHFCPSFAPRDETSPCPCTSRRFPQRRPGSPK